MSHFQTQPNKSARRHPESYFARLAGLGFVVLGLVFEDPRLGFEDWGLRFAFLALGFEVPRLGFEDWGLGFALLALGFEVLRLGFEDWGLGFAILCRILEAQPPRVGIGLGFSIWRRNLEAQTRSCLGFSLLRQKRRPQT